MHGLPEIGDVIDDTYEIISKLGAGGFGAVFLANHLPMDRQVALKMLLAHGPKPEEMVERFRREVMATRVLTHPNTVRIFDFRDSENHLLYYTMEHLRGDTLKALVKTQGAQSPRRVKHILRQILKSLSEAHSYGIIHRDLKPANIMLVEMHGETDFVKVLDFGIAKILDTTQEEDEEDPLTSAGMLVGTLRYMAPEQITGEQLGPMTDLYSLGLITAELLVGKSVFAGTGRWEVFQKQISEDAIELPASVLNSALGPFLQRTLIKRPAQRFQDAKEMLQALDAIPNEQLSNLALDAQSDIEFGAPDTNPSESVAYHSGAFSSSAVSVSQVRAPQVPAMPSLSFEEVPTNQLPEINAQRQVPEQQFSATPYTGPDTLPPEARTMQLPVADSSVEIIEHASEVLVDDPDTFEPPQLPFDGEPLPEIDNGNKKIVVGLAIAIIAIIAIVAVVAISSGDNKDETKQGTVAINLPNNVVEKGVDKKLNNGADKNVASSTIKNEKNTDKTPEDKTPVVPKSRTVTIDSKPNGALVKEGTKLIGLTPTEYTYKDATTLTVTLAKYTAQEVTVDEGSKDTILLKLKAIRVAKTANKTKTTKKNVGTKTKSQAGSKVKKTTKKSNNDGFIDPRKKTVKKKDNGGFIPLN